MSKQKLSSKKVVAIGLGAAVFTLLFIFVKVPSPIPETSFQTAYGVSAFFGIVFGPVVGGAIAFIGHGLSDSIQYGSPWWSWVISSGFASFIYGYLGKRIDIKNGDFNVKKIIAFNVVQIIGNLIAWILIAPTLDILIYKEPFNKVYIQGAIAALLNSVSVGVIGTFLLIFYAKSRIKKGSLVKE